jgi:hypothetical protein
MGYEIGVFIWENFKVSLEQVHRVVQATFWMRFLHVRPSDLPSKWSHLCIFLNDIVILDKRLIGTVPEVCRDVTSDISCCRILSRVDCSIVSKQA